LCPSYIKYRTPSRLQALFSTFGCKLLLSVSKTSGCSDNTYSFRWNGPGDNSKEEKFLIKLYVYSTIFHRFKDLGIISEVGYMLLLIGNFKIIPEWIRNFLLHYKYVNGILIVVRACSETQLDYSYYDFDSGLFCLPYYN
jgi:hypothetical protein